MPQIHPDVAAVLAAMQAKNLPAYTTMTPAEARLANAERNRYWNEELPSLAEIRDLTLERDGQAVRLRLYVPDGVAPAGPGIVFLHGGGWLFGSIDTHDSAARRIALASGCRLLSVDYSLAPERPFPAGLEDALAVIEGLRSGGLGLPILPDRLAIAGDSAGANLALAACLALRDRGLPQLRCAGLVYGVYSDEAESPSHLAFGKGDYVLSTEAMRWFWDHYVPAPAARRQPYASPLHADLRGLPPLHVVAAELDPLRDDSERLARRLVEARVDFDFRLWRGMTHAVLNWSRRVPAVDAHIADLAGFLAHRLA